MGPTGWLPVTDVSCSSHTKYSDPDAPPSLRVNYLCGLSSYSEYISLERDGYAREMAERWWIAMGGLFPVPETVAEALDRIEELAPVLAITVMRDGKYWRVTGRRLRRQDGEIDVNRWCRIIAVDRRSAKEIVDDEIRSERRTPPYAQQPHQPLCHQRSGAMRRVPEECLGGWLSLR
jgi:hypothetical protein